MSVWADRFEGVSTSIGAFCTTFWRYKKKNVHLAPLFLEPVVDERFLNLIRRCAVCGVRRVEYRSLASVWLFCTLHWLIELTYSHRHVLNHLCSLCHFCNVMIYIEWIVAVFVYVIMCVCVCMHVCTYVWCMYVCMMYECVCVYVCMYVRMYDVWMCVCMYVCIYVCMMYVCRYVCIYIYTGCPTS